ncbi:E3 ubiquitin-protein ligase TRIM71-like [Ptychodera flava]|uniref:E3 ubiquitin-protein ligase TRIM71-like n=1 Tax=Ptychodera flava TaxID=63121 RepID=UPI003969EADF
MIEIFKQRLESMQGTEIRCEGCQENTATHRCVECRHYLCNNCVKAHRNLPITQTHQLMTIGEYETAKSTNPVTLQAVEYCRLHRKNEIEFYCETCQVPVCSNCTIVKHRIPEHEHRDLKDAADEYLTELKTMVDKLKGDVGTRIKQLIIIETLAKDHHDDLIFTPNHGFSEHEILGILETDVCMSKCTVEHIPKQLWKGDSADLLITTRDSTGKQVIPIQRLKAKVRKPDASWEDINVADNRDGTHRVRVAGQLDGKYQVKVTIGDRPILGCPVIIPVIKGLVKTIGSEGSAEGQFNQPRSVAIDKDKTLSPLKETITGCR